MTKRQFYSNHLFFSNGLRNEKNVKFNFFSNGFNLEINEDIVVFSFDVI